MKHIFVTGGVVSGLGKGITAASLGRLLKARGFKVAAQKLDPYINVDPGTMSPYQHGEVYVTEDGAETDLDLGHYERFIDEDLNRYSNLTTGKVYANVLRRERQGGYLGKTVQTIDQIYRIGDANDPEYREGDRQPAKFPVGFAAENIDVGQKIDPITHHDSYESREDLDQKLWFCGQGINVIKNTQNHDDHAAQQHSAQLVV